MTKLNLSYSSEDISKRVSLSKSHENRCNKKTLEGLNEILENFHVDEFIKNDARHICSTFLNIDIPRKNRSHQLLVACLYIALKRGRSIIPFEKVCENANINPQHVRRMVKKVYEYCPYLLSPCIDTNEEIVLSSSSPKHVLESMVHLICEKEDLIKHDENIKNNIMCRLHDILSTSSSYLQDYQTCHLAIAIVFLCMIQSGMQMNKAEFAHKYGSSHATLHKYIILLNSVQKIQTDVRMQS